MKTRFTVLVILALSLSCPAQVEPIQQLFQSMLSHPSATPPSAQEFFSKVNENTVGALSAAQVSALLPLARQSLQSNVPEVRQNGLILIMAVSMRSDSATLLDPYIDDLGALLNGPEGSISLRHGALYVLGSTRPSPSPKAINYLNAHLEDTRNSSEETLTIAASLLEASPSDAITNRKVLSVVARRSDAGLTAGVIKTFGVVKTQNPEALAFLGASLNHPDRNVRESAVDAISRLDSNIRMRFAAQLARIASDPGETEYARTRANMALQK